MAKIAKKVVSESGVVWTFANGRVVSVDVTTLPASMQLHLAVHGMSAKGGDSYASAGDKGLTLDDCADGVEAIIANLRNEIWSAGGGSGSSILAEALAELTSKSVDDCVTVLAAMSDDARKELRKRPDVKAAIATIRANRARAKLAGTQDGDATDLADLF